MKNLSNNNAASNLIVKSQKMAMIALLLIGFSMMSMSFTPIDTPAEYEMIQTCPTADFTAPDGLPVGTPIAFQNKSSNANSFVWDFGDGNGSTVENPTHIYGAAGNYEVRLIVIGDGCSSEFIGTVDIIAD